LKETLPRSEASSVVRITACCGVSGFLSATAPTGVPSFSSARGVTQGSTPGSTKL